MNLSLSLMNFLEEANKVQQECNFKSVNAAVIVKLLVSKKGYINEFFKGQGVAEEEIAKTVEKYVSTFKEGEENVPNEYLKELIDKGFLKDENQKTIHIGIKIENSLPEDKLEVDLSVEMYILLMCSSTYGKDDEDYINVLQFEITSLTTFRPEFLKQIGAELKIDFKKFKDWYNDFAENHLEELKEINIRLMGEEYEQLVKAASVDNFIVDLTEEQAMYETTRILDMDDELEELYKIFSRNKKNNAVIFGDEGVGKSALVEALAFDIAHGTAKIKLDNFRVLALKDTVNYLELVTEYSGKVSATGQKIINYLEKESNYIFVIDELPQSISATEIYAITTFIKKVISVIAEKDDARLVIVSPTEEFELYFDLTRILPSRFDYVEVEETKTKKIASKLKVQIDEICATNEIDISKELVKFVITTSQCHFFNDLAEPGRTMEAIEKCLISAGLDGRNRVTKADVYDAFGINMKKFKKLTLKSKTSTAYHEAGHYIVGLLSESKQTKLPTAVSILPASNYAGVTMFEYTDQYASGDMDWLVDNVAVDLAGRVGEKMYTETDSIGASADLRSAARIVYTTILNFGMGEKVGKNQVVPLELLNDAMKKDAYDEAQNITQKGYDKAKTILEENKQALGEIVERLLKEGIVSGNVLEKIVYKYNPKVKEENK